MNRIDCEGWLVRFTDMKGRLFALATSLVVLLYFVSSNTRISIRGLSTGTDAADQARSSPWEVGPRHVSLIPMSSDELLWLDHQIQPPKDRPVTSSYCLHLLKARMDSGNVSSLSKACAGSTFEPLHALTDENYGSAVFGHSALIRTPTGFRFPCVEYRVRSNDPSLEAHRDQTLAIFGELGVSLAQPIVVAGAVHSLREVLRDSLSNFHLKQAEIEWTTTAYACYLPPVSTWTNRYGEEYSFNDLVAEIERRPPDVASCGGIHQLMALSALVRVDGESPVLTVQTRERLYSYLTRCLEVVTRTQNIDGSWPASWNLDLLPGHHPSHASLGEDPANRLLMTGHLAEWLLYLPNDVIRKRSETIARAGNWLRKTLLGASSAQREESFCPFAHAVCALKRIAFLSTESPASHELNRGSSGVERND